MPFTDMTRQYDGTYLYTAGRFNMDTDLKYLEPIVRYAHQVFGYDNVGGAAFGSNLGDGEGRDRNEFHYNCNV